MKFVRSLLPKTILTLGLAFLMSGHVAMPRTVSAAPSVNYASVSATIVWSFGSGIAEGSVITYPISSVSVSNLSVSGPSEASTYFSNWANQVNSGTVGGGMSVFFGTLELPPLPTATAQKAQYNLYISNSPYTDNTGFRGPSANVTFGGEIETFAGLTTNSMRLAGPVGGAFTMSAPNPIRFGGAPISADSFNLSGWSLSSGNLSVGNWNSAPTGVKSISSYGYTATSSQFDLASRTATINTSLTLGQGL